MKKNILIPFCILLSASGYLFGQGTWIQQSSFATQRCLMSAFAIGNYGYIGTGNGPSGAASDLWEYYPVTDTWTQKANLPTTPRFRGVGFSINGKGYMGLGWEATTQVCFTDLWEYDPVANTWSQKANFPSVGRMGAIAFSTGGKGYVGTGTDVAANMQYDDLWEYDPAANSWTAKANFPGGVRTGAVAFAVGSKGYVGLGGDATLYWNDLWEYDPASNSWLQKAPYPGPASFYGVGITIFNRGYVGTGSDGVNFYDDWYEFDPVTNSWAAMLNFPSGGRFHMIGFGINCRGYVGTGHWGNASSIWYDDWYEFIPPYFQFASVSNGGSSSICVGSSATLTAAGGSSYVWSTGATSTSIIVSPTTATTYTVTANTGAPLGCTSTATVTVFIKSMATSTSSTAINCTGGSGSASLTVLNGGTPPYSYFWSPTGQTTQTANGLTIPGNYTVTVTDSQGCSSTQTAGVTSINGPQAVVVGNTNLCIGDAATLTASGGNAYVWSNGSTSTSISFTPTSSVTYSLIATVGNCSDTTAATMNIYPSPVASSGNAIICAGEQATLVASGGSPAPYSYLWSTGASSFSIFVSPVTTTNYSVVVSIGTCSDTASANVTVNPLPVATVSPPITIVEGQTADLSASGGLNYLWSSGEVEQNISVSPQATTYYCVTAIDGNNCADTACTEVFVILCETAGALYLPNAFSPNGDAENDSLRIYFDLFDCIRSFHLTLYNRWGEPIYDTTDPLFKWTGIYNKEGLKNTDVAQSEVFVYHLDAVLGDQSKISKKGSISLFR